MCLTTSQDPDNLEVEATNTSLEDLDVIADYSIPRVRRPTLPPSYEQPGESSYVETFLEDEVEVVSSNSKDEAS